MGPVGFVALVSFIKPFRIGLQPLQMLPRGPDGTPVLQLFASDDQKEEEEAGRRRKRRRRRRRRKAQCADAAVVDVCPS